LFLLAFLDGSRDIVIELKDSPKVFRGEAIAASRHRRLGSAQAGRPI
jgi:hypothetical protein